MNNLVSIIVNCHNGQNFLNKSLNSIRNQSYKNWEVIFWDNCSTDNSEKILKSFNEKRFLYFKSKKITNLSAARNLAISKSKGKYICFLDVDDYWCKNKIFEQIKIFNDQDVALVFTNFYLEDEVKRKKKLFLNSKIENNNIINYFLKKYPVGISTVMFDKDKITKNLFDENYHIIGDFDFVMKASLNNKILGINDSLVTILLHENNETKKKFKLYVLELLIWYKKHKEVFLNYKNFNYLRSNIYYEISKACIIQKKLRRSLTFFKYISTINKLKILLLFFKI